MSDKALPIVTIVGRPNVGKSSLFNRLAGERKAIVADTPGTTRDRVQSIVEWNGRSFWLIDTAGEEAGNDELAESMQEQIDLAREQADLILIVIDSSTILSDADSKIIKKAFKSGKPILIAANKADRQNRQAEFDKLPSEKTLLVSAIHGTGSGDLLDAISEHIPKQPAAAPKQPTLALLGRPNVGKSSLLNVLSGERRAVVSGTGGTTRDVTETSIKHEDTNWKIIDTAGLRRTGKRGHDIERFSALRTVKAINDSDICVLVADATDPATSQDQRIAGMVREAGKGLVIAVNKWDLTERSDTDVRSIKEIFHAKFQFVWWAPLLLVSATETHNIGKILPLAESTQHNRQRQLDTNTLNDFLQKAVADHPPAGLKNRHPKLKYITQVDTQPPTFAVFGSQTPYLHWSYKRFLEGRLREEFDFIGTPIRFKWREKDKQGNKA